MTGTTVVSVSKLRIELQSKTEVVAGVDFEVARGEVLALVGESGSGKTSIALALLAHTRRGLRISGGSVRVCGRNVLDLGGRELRATRGQVVSYVPQDPTDALDPSQRVGSQVEEALKAHGWRTEAATTRVVELCERVGLPSSREFLRRYPFQLSGGQQQRIAIAIALGCNPDVIVLDEPTTGLDVTTQARILDLLGKLKSDANAAMVYVTHDLAIVQEIADHVAVLYSGSIVEHGRRDEVFEAPAHPYTAMLLSSVPRLSSRQVLTGIAGTAPAPDARGPGCPFEPRCPAAADRCAALKPDLVPAGAEQAVACWFPRSVAPIASSEHRVRNESRGGLLLEVNALSATYPTPQGPRKVLDEVSITMSRSECLAIVGESGSGKTTLGRCIAGLHAHTVGELRLDGRSLAATHRERDRIESRSIQLIYQNPDRSLNPRESVRDAVVRSLRAFASMRRSAAAASAEAALERVRLPRRTFDRYPTELSGGEKQRVAIARAIVLNPALLICDEITSALDVSIQAAIVALLAELREDGTALLFITHNLPLVSSLADRVAVLNEGRVCEYGPTSSVIGSPVDTYTQELVAAAPDFETAW